MLGFFTLISLLYNANANGLGFTHDISNTCYFFDKDICLENYFCKWCNTTDNDIKFYDNKDKNFKESCSLAENICSSNFNKSSLCQYNEHYKNYCNFFNIFDNLIILFILFASTYSITYSIISNLLIETKNNNLAYIFIITLLINIPAFILWGTYSHYFLFYMFSLILLSIFSCFASSTQKYIKYKNNQIIDYQSLN